MKRIKVTWTEYHSEIVETDDYEDAIRQALDGTSDVLSRKNQSLEGTQEVA